MHSMVHIKKKMMPAFGAFFQMSVCGAVAMQIGRLLPKCGAASHTVNTARVEMQIVDLIMSLVECSILWGELLLPGL